MTDPGRYPAYPQMEPLDPPDVEVSVAPNVTLTVNEAWRSFLIGQLFPFAYPSSWRGTQSEIDLAVDRCNELIGLLMVGDAVEWPGGVRLDDPLWASLDDNAMLG